MATRGPRVVQTIKPSYDQTIKSENMVLLYNGESQVVMVAKKDDDGESSVFSEPLLKPKRRS